jgi:hypothetical protein
MGVMAWMDGLVFAGGATEAGWLPPGSGASVLHDVGPKRATTAISNVAALGLVLVLGHGRFPARCGGGFVLVGNRLWYCICPLFSCLLTQSRKVQIRPRIVVRFRLRVTHSRSASCVVAEDMD